MLVKNLDDFVDVDFDLKACNANIDKHSVFNKNRVETYICKFFSKTGDQCSQAMKQATKDALENNKHHHGAMKTIFQAHLNNRKCSGLEPVYRIFPQLRRRIFPDMYLVNTNFPEEKLQVLLFEKEVIY